MVTEDVESFRLRARAWLAQNMPKARHRAEWIGYPVGDGVPEEEEMANDRRLQRLLYDGGFGGVCFPLEYGGQGLSLEHQRAWCAELAGYDYPALIQIPTLTPCAPVLLEFGTPEQKAAHLPAILRGDEVWMQLLSEPSGGSDAAGAQTTAVRDGAEWVINGSKIWTSGAWMADWGLALVRTNPDVTKHRGLTVFMIPLKAPGVEVHQIEMLNGTKDFCQEFFTDVRIPDSYRIGDVDDGWTVATRWMYYERTVSGGSPYVTRPVGPGHERHGGNGTEMIALARATGRLEDPCARQLIGETHVLDCVRRALTTRLATLMNQGRMSEHGSAVGRLFSGRASVRTSSIAYELAGAAAGCWEDADEAVGTYGVNYLVRQASCIGGGTTEISANVVSERLLGMPRERTADRDVAFRDIPKGPSAARALG